MAAIIKIEDRRSGEFVDAIFHDGLTPAQLDAAESDWKPLRRSGSSEHGHWDWRRKAAKFNLLANRFFGIECEGRFQGLMVVTTAGYNSRMASDVGKPLVYVDYIETAPWNLKSSAEPRFGAIGTRLFEIAVHLSFEVGFSGRVGLHSLPQSEGFYASVCGMTPIGKDPKAQYLQYFELRSEAAKAFAL